MTLGLQSFSKVSCYQNVSILDVIGAKDNADGDVNCSCKVLQSYIQIVTTNKPTPSFLRAGYPSCRSSNSVKALKLNVVQQDSKRYFKLAELQIMSTECTHCHHDQLLLSASTSNKSEL